MVIFKLDESDFLSAQSLHRRWSRRKIVVVILLAVAASGLGWLLWHQGVRSAAGGIIGGVIGGVVGGAIGGAADRYLYVPWKSRRVFRQQKSFQHEFTLSWSDEGMHVKYTDGEYSSAWSDFIRWKENDRLFLIYLSDVTFYIIPKRAFVTASEVQEFRCHLARSVPGKGNATGLKP